MEPSGEVDTDGLPAELRMDEYDDEDDGLDGLLVQDEEDEEDVMAMDSLNDHLLEEAGDEEEGPLEEEEDDEIRASDHVIALAVTEDEYSHLEVQVYTSEGSLYTHHDILLPDFPLSLAWLDCPPALNPEGAQQQVGNFIAVGTFSPAIEIWNLDVLDAIEPSAVLGGVEKKAKKKSKAGKKKKADESFRPGSHEDAVLSLSWNTVYRQALASGSADHTVKVWDVTTQTCSHTFRHHSDKVQSVVWHPSEAYLLGTGSFDKKIGLVDCRSATCASSSCLSADIESLAWDPFNSYHLYAALENGEIASIDVRNASSNSSSLGGVINSFRAHGKAVSSIQFSSLVNGMMATASVDKTVKVWDVHNMAQSGEEAPRCVAYKTMNVGKLLTMQFSHDEPFMLATAGDKGMLAIWESDENEVIRNHFSSRVVQRDPLYAAPK